MGAKADGIGNQLDKNDNVRDDNAKAGADRRPGFAMQLVEDLSPGDVRLVLGVFAADLRRLADSLAINIQADNAQGFHRAAHALAGAAGAVGAMELENSCRRGMHAHAPAIATLAELHAAIVAQVVMTELELAAFLRRLDGRDV
jgi:HPt (histidine-containing phosphotransfer) domain-containing protein